MILIVPKLPEVVGSNNSVIRYKFQKVTKIGSVQNRRVGESLKVILMQRPTKLMGKVYLHTSTKLF